MMVMHRQHMIYLHGASQPAVMMTPWRYFHACTSFMYPLKTMDTNVGITFTVCHTQTTSVPASLVLYHLSSMVMGSEFSVVFMVASLENMLPSPKRQSYMFTIQTVQHGQKQFIPFSSYPVTLAAGPCDPRRCLLCGREQSALRLRPQWYP